MRRRGETTLDAILDELAALELIDIREGGDCRVSKAGDGGVVGPGGGLREIDGVRDLPLAVEGDRVALCGGEGGRGEQSDRTQIEFIEAEAFR